MANRDYGKNCSTAVKKMADGGAVGESVGFWERLKAGNIDQEGSEAYNRWGAGAKKMDAELDAASASFKDLPTKTGSEPSAPAPAAGMDDRDRRDAEREASTTPKQTNEIKAEPAESIAVRPVSPSGKSFGTGLSSGYASMKNSKAAHAAMQKKNTPAAKPAAPAVSRPTDASQIPGNKGIETKEAERMAQIPGRTSNDADLDRRVAMIPMANGGMVGGNRNYGKK